LAPTQTAPPAKSAGDLVQGKDYPYIEISDDMAPAEIRKARIANAKAKSAAIKALGTMPTSASAETASTPVAVEEPPESPAVDVATTTAVGEPVAGVDYLTIEITDGMDPADVRKARIANAKAKSAAMKVYKQAGG
jgi:precorrin-3B methylase